MMKAGRILGSAILALGLAGCQSSPAVGWPESDHEFREQPAQHAELATSAVFSSVAVASLLGEQGLAPGFTFGDWEFGRRDLRLPAGFILPPPTYGSFFIFERESIHESNGRVRTHGRRTIYSIEGGSVR